MGDHEALNGLAGDLEKMLSSKEVIRHLLQRCGPCQEAVKQEWLTRKVGTHLEVLSPKQSDAYEAALDRALENVRRIAYLPEAEQQRFQRAITLLRSGDGLRALVETGGMSLEGLGVYEALLARSWAVRYDDPREMCHLANLAVEMCDSFEQEAFSACRVADLRARAWGELANAYRVANRYREAETAFGKAFEWYQLGSSDRSLRMRLLDLQASLFGTLREFSLALQSLTTLAEMYQADGDLHLAGKALIAKALYTFYWGDVDKACQEVGEGLSLINPDRDPTLALVAAFDQILFLVESGRFKQAKRAIFENRSWLKSPGKLAGLKLRWIEGRISYGLLELASAEIAISEAKEGFAKAEMPFACALSGLDLALTLLRQGRQAEAVHHGLEAATLFSSLSLHREILGTAVLLDGAFRAQTTNLELIEASVKYLRKKMIEMRLG
ncbi:MAG TPA: hypothetical protein VF173_26470 [Thermoanaerobaculia bacterium]|nr:hypothetical protein [Thermoanaerobaculia bacterium]